MDAALSELIIGGFVLAILLMEAALSPRRQTRSMGHFSLFGCLLALAVTLSRWGAGDGGHWLGVADDSFALYCEVVLLAGAALALLIVIAQPAPPRSETCALVLMSGLGMMIAAAAADLLILFLGLELTFISLQILTASARFSAVTGEAAVKLTAINAAASGLFLMGFAFLYGATGSTDFAGIATALPAADQRLSTVGMGLILIALGLRLGAVPLHLWLPDVWQGASLPVTALLSSGAMVASLAATMRLLAHGLEPLHATWIPIVSVTAVATMTVGNLLALGQRYLKRALACAGVAQAGFALSGLAAFHVGGLGALTFSLTVVALLGLGTYAAISLCSQPEDGLTEIDDYSGLGRRHPLLGFGLAVLLLALAGLPPTVGFAARMWLAEVAIENGSTALAAAVVGNTVLSAYLCLRIAVRLFMVAPRTETALPVRLNPEAVAVVALAVLAGLAAGLWPALLMEVARQSAQAIL